MVALYLASWGRGSGKTTLAAGLGKRWLSEGKKVGFFKPLWADNLLTADNDGDAAFMKRLFHIEEAQELLCPVFREGGALRDRVKEAYTRIASGKDVVLVEGVSPQHQASRNIIEVLNAKVLGVEGYSKELLKVIDSYRDYREYLLGVVCNKVPRNWLEQVSAEIFPSFTQAGIDILGVLPEDRTLLAFTIGELAESIRGEILRGAEKRAELVENFMLGAMPVDSALGYFGRKDNKAVIVRSNRPDMQLAALETSTRCLVLAGDMAPMPVVRQQAEVKNVSIILVRDNIATIATRIEDTLSKTRFNQENKLPKLAKIMEQHFDFPRLNKGLGL